MFRALPALAAILLLAPAALAADPAPAFTVSVAPDAPSYTALQVANGEATVSVGVVDIDGIPVAGAAVTLHVIHKTWVGNVGRDIVLQGTTGDDGTASFTLPSQAALPMGYTLTATYSPDAEYIGTSSVTVTVA